MLTDIASTDRAYPVSVLPPLLPLAPPPSPAVQSLAERGLTTLREFFARQGHDPSPAMWAALEAVAENIEAMADGTCQHAVHLCSLDPGVGKTATVVHTVRALLASPKHKDVGVIICAQRRDQIAAMVKDAELDPRDFAVLTADDKLNDLSPTAPDRARVLFTTHAMVERRCEGRAFSNVAAFKYRGQPRAVRVWDEAILPGRALTVPRDALGALFGPLRGRYPGLTGDLENLFMSLGDADDGEQIGLPDLAAVHGVDLNEALGAVNGPADEVTALWLLFGKTVTVRRDGAYGNTVLDYHETLPEDIKPVLVLDASARVRTTYQFWQDQRGGITRLPEATKCYDNHTIHVWDHGGGKTSFRQNGRRLIEGVASTIQTKPNEAWLIVHHKEAGVDGVGFEEAVRAMLPRGGDGLKLHFLNWGRHDATNQFADVPNVILAGTLFYRTSYYEALGRLSAGKPSARGNFDKTSIEQVKAGEHRNLILQAMSRGAVRQCVGDGCPTSDTYIIASRKSGIPQELPSIFPGANIATWNPTQRPLTGKVAEAAAFIIDRLTAEPDATVSFKSVMDGIGWRDRANFKRRIRQHTDFEEALSARGIEETRRGFRRVV
jgi:hypothetical protein